MASTTGINNSGTINVQTINNRVMGTSPPEIATPTLYMVEDTNIHFYGRDDKIEEIKKALEERKENSNSLCRTVVLVGFGGMGKSETAKAFAQKFLQTYDYIVWINSQTEQSVEASFRELARRMNTGFNSLDDVSEIQAKLTNNFKNGLIIFDNAEGLYAADNQFGIENLLFKTFPKNKPIFLATSRNGSRLWGGMDSQIKFIDIDRLTDEEATKILKNYLLFKDEKIPPSVETAISSLVKILDGYPLGLSLVGSTIVEKARDVSFDNIESRIKAYIEILKDVPLGEVSREFKYEEALKLIYNQTIKKIMARENGSTAIELLNIMACLNPDGLYLGLVNAIYSGTTCKSRWDNEVTNPNVTKGFVILMDYSIVKRVESERLQIHRLIQQCVRKTQVSQEALNNILTFFQQNEDNHDWYLHIHTLINLLKTGVCLDRTEYFLCMLLWRSGNYYFKQCFAMCKSYFSETSSNELTLLKLAEIYFNSINEGETKTMNWEEIETGILNLPYALTRQLWVVEVLLRFLQDSLKHSKVLELFTRERINTFIINCCMEFTNEKLGKLIPKPDDLLITIYGRKCTRNVRGDSAFLKKLFGCPPKELRNYLWDNYLEVEPVVEHNYSFNEILKVFGLQWIIDSLAFTDDEERLDLCIKKFDWFLDNLLDVWETLRNCEQFAKSPEFVSAFMNISNFYLETTFLVDEEPENKYLRLSLVIICLIDADQDIYDNYNSCLELKFQNTLKHLKQKCKSYIRSVHEILARWGGAIRLQEFRLKVENCLWKPKWATDFLEFLATPPLEALFHNFWDILEKPYVIQLFKLENISEEEQEIRFFDVIFTGWGVDGFTAALKFRQNPKTVYDAGIESFGNYVANLLKVWKTLGNFEHFLKSPDFVHAFIREGKLCLENICFRHYWDTEDYVGLSIVVIRLFDADKKIYDEFSDSLVPLFEKCLNHLNKKIKTDPLDILESLSRTCTKRVLKELQQLVENCNWKPAWVLKLLEITKCQPTDDIEGEPNTSCEKVLCESKSDDPQIAGSLPEFEKPRLDFQQ